MLLMTVSSTLPIAKVSRRFARISLGTCADTCQRPVSATDLEAKRRSDGCIWSDVCRLAHGRPANRDGCESGRRHVKTCCGGWE